MLIESLKHQARLSSSEVAITFENSSVTFQEIDFISDQIAVCLNQNGVKPNVLVGICAERGIGLIVGILGILKSGGAYLPIDWTLPGKRLEVMLTEAKPQVILADKNLFSVNNVDFKILPLDSKFNYTKDYISKTSNVKKILDGNSLAYVLYTSGSTGKPKCVGISHNALNNHMQWMMKAFQFTKNDKVLFKTPYTFDASVWEILISLLTGSQMIIAPDGAHKDPYLLIDLIRKYQVTTIQIVPTIFLEIINNINFTKCYSLKRVFVGGEVLNFKEVKTFYQKNKKARLYNLYGPTEATIDTTCFDCHNINKYYGQTTSVPIGKPIDNVSIYILNDENKLVEKGEVGEIFIGGAGLANGYINNEKLTKKCFVSVTCLKNKIDVLYKTGDLGKWLPDGNIEFVGRVDNQVKIRGYRVELNEIVFHLNNHPEIKQALVLLDNESSKQSRIVSYILTLSKSTLKSEDLIEYLKRYVPDYMIPSFFVFVDKIPLLTNGKVDQSLLKKSLSTKNNKLPANKIEKKLLAIYAEILDVPINSIGTDDNFYHIGGHSLAAMQIISRIRTAYSIEFSVEDFLKFLTVEALSREIGYKIANRQNKFCLSLKPNKTHNKMVPLSCAQERLWFLAQSEPDNPFYNVPLLFKIDGDLKIKPLMQALQFILERHSVLRTSFVRSHNRNYQNAIFMKQYKFDFKFNKTNINSIEQIYNLAYQESRIPFDLSKGNLIKFRLYQLSEYKYCLLICIHHIVGDGWSLNIFYEELGKAYSAYINNKKPEMEALPVQYVDYSLWQQEYLASFAVEKQIKYWKNQLRELPNLELPLDYPRPSHQKYIGERIEFNIPLEIFESLDKLSKQQGCTLFVILLSAFDVLLKRYTGSNDIVLGASIAGRKFPEFEKLIGFFANMLVLRSDLTGDLTFLEVMQINKRITLDAYANQDVPFEKIVEELHPKRLLDRNPLFQVALTLEPYYPQQLKLPNLKIEMEQLDIHYSLFDLSLFFEVTDNGLKGAIEYNTELFKKDTIDRFVEHLNILFEKIVNNPNFKINSISILTSGEKQLLCNGISYQGDVAPAMDSQKTVIDYSFENQVDKASANKELTKLDVEDTVISPIGKPIPNMKAFVLDANKQIVPFGVVGELYISGNGVSSGYLHNQALTKERFIFHSFGDKTFRLYKTGDLVKLLHNGELSYIGRNDEQVKIRGFRIEIGEIEACLNSHPAVKQAVVLDINRTYGKSLYAYIVANSQVISREFHETCNEWHINQIESWGKVFQAAYQPTVNKNSTASDSVLNFSGWNSSCDGLPIPKKEMLEWLGTTIGRIKSLNPKRVLEIGCGTGLILFSLASSCDYYCATDLSLSALDYIKTKQSELELANIKLLNCDAKDFSKITEQNYDIVIINSVMQYFPGVKYFIEVIKQSLEHVIPGGYIFIGDVRNFDLLELFHSSIQLQKKISDISYEKWKSIIIQQIKREKELLLSPKLFCLLKVMIPEISAINIQMRRGSYNNEMNNFRYDVIIQKANKNKVVDSNIISPNEYKDWGVEQMGMNNLEILLASNNSKSSIVVRNIPNKRTTNLAELLKRFESCGHVDISSIDVIQKKSKLYKKSCFPEAIWQLGEKYSYQSYLSWSDINPEQYFDAIFVKKENIVTENLIDNTFIYSKDNLKTNLEDIDWSLYSNEPVNSMVKQKLMMTLRNYMEERLPNYMIPSGFVFLDNLPLLHSGKLNKRALFSLHHVASVGKYVAPRTTTEVQLAKIWQKLLDIEEVSILGDFFELGGHSLLAVQLIFEIQKYYNVDIRISDIFESSTISKLSKLINDKLSTQSVYSQSISTRSSPIIVNLLEGGNKSPLFLIHPIGGVVFWYKKLANYLKIIDRPIFGIQDPSLESNSIEFASIEEMAGLYLQEIKKIQPVGPYLLGGASFGGVVSIEIASQLIKEKNQVTFLGLFDSWPKFADEMKNKQSFKRKMRTINHEFLSQLEDLKFHSSEFWLDLQWRRAQLLFNYNIPKITNKITLFKALEMGDNKFDAKSNYWDKYSNKSVDVYKVSGTHHSMFEEPNLQFLAEALLSSLKSINE